LVLDPPRYDLSRPEALPMKLRVPLAKRGPYLLSLGAVNGQNAGAFCWTPAAR
jgi:hypothetical protein